MIIENKNFIFNHSYISSIISKYSTSSEAES